MSLAMQREHAASHENKQNITQWHFGFAAIDTFGSISTRT